MRSNFLVPLVCGVALSFSACATVASSRHERDDLVASADRTLTKMRDTNAKLGKLLVDAHAYVVFPEIGEGALVAGGAFGRGVVYERGEPIAWAELDQGSFGAQLGGQTYSELIVLKDEKVLRDFMRGGIHFGGEATAIVITSGAAVSGEFGEKGVATFVLPKAGFMAGVTLTGQEIDILRRDPPPKASAMK